MTADVAEPSTALTRLARWGAALSLDEVPETVRRQAVNQVLSTLGAVYSGFTSDLGPPLAAALAPAAPGAARVIPTGAPATPAHAAFQMAAWSMVLDYDDVMLGGHTGHSSVLVPLAFAAAEGRSGGDLVLAQVVANEIAARINMVCAVGSTRGQMATHLHLLAAAAARAKLAGFDAGRFAAALGFALSYPARALFPAFLGSDAKVMAAAWPLRMGLESVEAVAAGLTAPADVLDDPRGLFATLAAVPVREFLGGLGERWHTATNSFKVYPACGYLAAVLDATLEIVRQHRPAAAEVAAVEVSASIFTYGMDAHSAPYLDGPRSPLAALTFSTPYTVACALVAGELGPEQLTRRWRRDPRVWELAARVRVRHDTRRTLRALTADIPVGAALTRIGRMQAAGFGLALAGKAFGRGGRWRRPLTALRLAAGLAAAAGSRRPLNLENASKPLGARVEVVTGDGRRLSAEVDVPRGFAGAGDWRQSRRLMHHKLVTCATPVVGAAAAAEAAVLAAELPALPAGGVRRLTDLCCRPGDRAAAPSSAAASGAALWPVC